MASGPIHTTVYWFTPEEREQVRACLSQTESAVDREYDGCFELWATAETVAALERNGFLVDVDAPREVPLAAARARDIPFLGPEAPFVAAPDAARDPDVPEDRQARELVAVFEAWGDTASMDLRAEIGRLSAADALVPQQPANVYNVHLIGAMSPDRRELLKSLGLEYIAFDPPDSYRMLLTPEQADEARRLPFVKTIEEYGIANKVRSSVLDAFAQAAGAARATPLPMGPALPEFPEDTVGLETYEVVLHRHQDLPTVQRVLARAGAFHVLDSDGDVCLRLRCAPDSPYLAALVSLPQVRRLSLYRPPRLLVDAGRRLLGIEQLVPMQGVSWTGRGERVGILDSGIQDHPDLRDAVRAPKAAPGICEIDCDGHGTHVAGIIAGSGAGSRGKIVGVAPGAELITVAITDTTEMPALPADIAPLLRLATDEGARILNLSWGQGVDGDYDSLARSLDRFVYENPDVLVVVAAGNTGPTHRISSPATAKNGLTVGASGTSRTRFRSLPDWAHQSRVAAFSCRGPASALSVKPDMVAPGVYVRAACLHDTCGLVCDEFRDAQGRNLYAYMTGSSMAAPMVSGTAAIVREYLRTRADHPIPEPSAALVKAILIASAMPLAQSSRTRTQVGFPDYDQGYGRVNPASILPHRRAPDRRRVLCVDVPNGGPQALLARQPAGNLPRSLRRYWFRVAADASDPLRIVLAWTDVPGAGLQNNLDLIAEGPELTRQFGNGDHRAGAACQGGASRRGDCSNNVERLAIPHPAPGIYTLTVYARNTPGVYFNRATGNEETPTQGYALCVCGDVESERIREY